MKEHLAENFSIAALAETLQVTPAYFTRLFVRQTGQSPISYLTDLRITYALSLLADTSCSVSMISRECGFSCRNYFCKVFRKAQGCSPIEYRKRIRQEREALSDQENCQSV